MEQREEQFSEQDIGNLFSMPQVLVQLLEACLEGTDAASLSEIVIQDTALSARVLHAASKTCPGQLDPAEPLTSALQGLGLPVVKGIALQAAKRLIGRQFSEEELLFLHGLWFYSGVSGQTARCVAASISYPHVEEAQLSGVLLNLGMHLLLARHGQSYAELAEQPLSSSRLRRLEDGKYHIDHLRIADDLVKSWQIDSFLVDAIRFLHVEIDQLENCGQLLKIARLAHQFGISPENLSDDTRQLAKRLFGFRTSEIEYLFDWAQSLYAQQLPTTAAYDLLQEELRDSLNRLTALAFGLADQEAARARLACNNTPEELAKVARNLYLENSSAGEAIFFLVDQKSNRLVGLPAEGQPRTIRELSIPLDATLSLAPHALLKGEPLDTFSSNQPLSVFDHLLLRLCQSRGLCCQPFRRDAKLLGVVVLGIDSQQDIESLQSLRLKMYTQVMGSALEQIARGALETLGSDTSVLRRACHEVSNPLTIISNYAEVLRHQLENGENSGLAEAIKKEVRRVDDILNYYLNQQEMPQFPEQRICLNQLVRDALDALRLAEIEPRKIDVKLDLQESLIKVVANAVLVKQVLVNLIKNAAEAIGENGLITLKTHDRICADGGRLAEIVIQDNGPGISEDMQQKLFRPVVSTKGPGHAGVGLSIVKTMVEDLGARISCHSSASSGTVFSLQIAGGDPAAAPVGLG